jgi:hypothetical protein
MTLPSARLNLSPEWGKSARCPICAAAPLNIIHPPQRPDEFRCPRCGAEFEVEQGGSRIWLNALPPDLQEALTGRWVTINEVQEEVAKLNQRREPAAEKSAFLPDSFPPPTSENQPVAVPFLPQTNIPTPGHPAPDPRFVAQAKELYALGNSVAQIRVILQRTQGVKPAELDAIMAEVTGLDRKKHNRQTRNLIIAAFVSLVVVSCCVAVVYLGRLPLSIFQNNARPGSLPVATNQSSIFNLINLPDSMKTLMPDEMTVVNSSPPVIIPGSVGDTATYPCPKSADQAAQLFGGLTENWSYKQGWIMVSKSALTVHVPAGMFVGYVVFSPDMEMKSVNGPVTLQNIYMVIISCD